MNIEPIRTMMTCAPHSSGCTTDYIFPMKVFWLPHNSLNHA